MARYRFWILFGACLAAAAVVWFLAVPKKIELIRQRSDELQRLADRAEALEPKAVGLPTLESQASALGILKAKLSDLEGVFEKTDRQNLDLWFPELNMNSWDARPAAADFKPQFLRAYDALQRVLANIYQEVGVKVAAVPLIEYPWMKDDDRPAADQLRFLQRTYWVQDRLLRAVARYGAVPVEPIEVGITEKPLGLGNRVFNRRHYRITLDCPTRELKRLLHAFDGPFRTQNDQGKKEQIGLRVAVDQVSVARQKLDTDLLEDHLDEPPVRVSFDLVVLNFENEGGS